jgi:ABC-type oligopeptide transport system substrate-binding subunit
MKKLLTLGLSLLAVVAALSLSACGQKEETPGTGTTTEQPAQPETGSGAPAAPEGGTGGDTTEGGTGGGQ